MQRPIWRSFALAALLVRDFLIKPFCPPQRRQSALVNEVSVRLRALRSFGASLNDSPPLKHVLNPPLAAFLQHILRELGPHALAIFLVLLG